MIGKHCGEYTRRYSENRKLFSRQCVKCLRIFTQRKRQPTHHNRFSTMKKGGN